MAKSLRFYRQLCDRSFYHFVKIVGGAAKQGGDITAAIHRPLCDSWQNPNNKRVAIFMPRGWFKSTVFTKWGTIWRYLQDNESRILIPSENENIASRFLSFIKLQILQNETLRTIYPELQAVDTSWTRGTRWSTTQIDLPKQGIYSEASITAIGAGGAAQSGHYTDISIDDLVGKKAMESTLVMEGIFNWHDNLKELLVNPNHNSPAGSRIRLIGCLPSSERVLMSDGTWRNIDKVIPGEVVATYHDNTVLNRRVDAVMPQGEDDIYEIKTAHGTIRANGNHKFLTVVPTNVLSGSDGKVYRIKEHDLDWVKLSHLQCGDYLVSLDKLDSGRPVVRPDGVPVCSDFAWLFGFITGDGWATSGTKNKSVSFSPGIYGELNDRAEAMFLKLFGKKMHRDSRGSYICYSKDVMNLFLNMGLKKGAANKDVPSWVFTLPVDSRIAFIRGLLDADGCAQKNSRESYAIEVASKSLIDQLKLLCSTCGIVTGQVRHRQRTIQAPNSPLPVLSDEWSLSVNFGYPYKYKTGTVLGFPQGGNFRLEKIQDITYQGKEAVYDLAIDGTHNFIAEGFVTHNTHWATGDYGCYVQENYPEYKWLIVPALKDDSLADAESIHWLQHPEVSAGESNWPDSPDEKYSTEHYQEMQAHPEQELVFYAQHQNNPRKASGFNKFEYDTIKWFHFEDKERGKYIVCDDDGEEFRLAEVPLYGKIDPGGFAEMKHLKRGSRNAILIGGQPRNTLKRFVVYTWAGRLKKPSDFINEVFKANELFHPRRFDIEVVAQQPYIYKHIKEEMARQKKNFKLSPMPFDSTKDIKDLDIQALMNPMFNGEIYLHRSMKELIGEIKSYPQGLTCDLLDMLGKINKQNWKDKLRKDIIKTARETWNDIGGRDRVTGY